MLLASAVVGLVCVAFYLYARKSPGKDPESKFSLKDGITLFDHPMSPCARRVRIVLKEKKIKHHVVVVDLMAGENRHPSFLAINPLGKVPAMVVHNRIGIPDCCLYESNAITEWLDEQFPDACQLYPSDPWERAQVKNWQKWEMEMAEDFWPTVYVNSKGFIDRFMSSRVAFERDLKRQTSDPYYYFKMMKTFDGELLTQAELRRNILRLFKWLDVLETGLQNKEYLVSDKFTVAEVSVLPRVAMYPILGMLSSTQERQRYPNVIHFLSCTRLSLQESSGILAHLPWSVIEWVGNWRSGKKHRRMYGRDFVNELEAISKVKKLPTTSSTHEVVLYTHCPQPDSIMLEIACNELRVPHKVENVDMMVLENKGAGYASINPAGVVPTLIHKNRMIYDVKNIMEYLNAVLPGDLGLTFLPVSATERARVHMWQGWAGTLFNYQMMKLYEQYVVLPIIQSTYNSRSDLLEVLRRYGAPSDEVDDVVFKYESKATGEEIEVKMAPYKSAIVTALEYLNKELNGRQFLVGCKISTADITVFSLLLLLKWVSIDIDGPSFQHINYWLSGLLARKSFASAKSKVDEYMQSHGLHDNHIN